MADLLSLIERLLLFTWLVKDFGWMTTNSYLGFPFGVLAVILHVLLIVVDDRRSYRFYHCSLLFWVTGNFIWMSIELMSTDPSSNIHLGPAVPIGGMSPEMVSQLNATKTSFFVIGSFVQILMYVLIYTHYIYMPEEENEDMISRNEIHLLCGHHDVADSNTSGGTKNHYVKQNDIDSLFDSVDDFSDNQGNGTYSITLAFIEHAYIIFWINKDLFWSCGTGELGIKGRDPAIVFETAAILFGTLAICVYVLTSYIYRRNLIRFLDSLTTILWIAANFVWMCGEFFLRYDNMAYDDHTEHNDGVTRIISAVLFCSGIALQLFVMVRLCMCRGSRRTGNNLIENSHMSSSSSGNSSSDGAIEAGGGRYIEMFSRLRQSVNFSHLSSNMRYENVMMTSFSPQQNSRRRVSEDEEEESTILF